MIENLGSGRAAGKILAFLSEKHGMKFTRSRICLAVGIATNGGNTTDVFSTLKRNNSIIEQGREIWMNPDLYIVDYFTKKGEPPDETILHTIDSASCRRVHADQLLLE